MRQTIEILVIIIACVLFWAWLQPSKEMTDHVNTMDAATEAAQIQLEELKYVMEHSWAHPGEAGPEIRAYCKIKHPTPT